MAKKTISNDKKIGASLKQLGVVSSSFSPNDEIIEIELQIDDPSKTAEINRLLKRLAHLQTVSLRDTSTTDLSVLKGLNRLQEVRFTGCGIKDISDLAEINSLTHIWAGSNQIESIEALQRLHNLKELYLHNNKIESIKAILKLKKLQVLTLASNPISSFAGISKLNQIKRLNVSLSSGGLLDISKMPSVDRLEIYDSEVIDPTLLTRMPSLTSLDIWQTKIENIESLASLPNLVELSLSSFNLKDISWLAGLKNITHLELSNNVIEDIEPLHTLNKLQYVGLSGNRISRLPIWITKLGLDVVDGYSGTEIGKFVLSGNPLKYPPMRIIAKGNSAIDLWFKGKRVYVNEAKVLLVGHGEVGKTTLVKALMGQKTNPKELPTPHISISPYSVKKKNKKIKLNFWDFGGQEVMHSTHQFFLSDRSLYLLVLDGRRDEDAEYWLKHIESYGGNSPVLVILNKIDTNRSFDVNREFLQKKYPFIVAFHRTVAHGRKEGITELKKSMIKALDKVEILTTPWPEDWIPIKNKLESLRDDFISQKQYEQLCSQNKIKDESDQETLAGFLNDLGVIVHFKDLGLSDLHILQPRWAARAAYKIINSPKVADKKNNGVLMYSWLTDIMKKEDENDFIYHNSTFPFIIDLMRKFELCYPIEERKKYLIPELMDIQQPSLPKHKGPVLNFFLKFEELLPRSILSRFIVRMHEDIQDELRWRTGVVLSIPIFDSLAIIVADIKEKTINISISGSGRREHFAIIRKTFHSIKSGFETLPLTEWIPLPDVPSHAIEYQELVGYEQSGEEEILIGKLKKRYKVKDLLNGIEPSSIRNEEYKWDAFLCHSTSDKQTIRLIANDLKSKGISYWLDEEQISPGDSIIDKITDGLLRSKNIIPCLSKKQLTSGWCRKEYQAILSRVISGISKQKVAPLIIDDTNDRDIPLFLGDVRGERYLEKDQYERMLIFLSSKT